MRVWIMTLAAIACPVVCYADLAGVIGEAFGPGGPGRAVIWIVALDVGRWLIKTVAEVCGKGSGGKWIDYIVRSAQVGIVIASVYGLVNTAFNLLGL